jgi:diacylglycerol kinase (ATP)
VREGYAQVVAVGGDGTVNEVAQALVRTSVVLGLIPCGSGNGLALHLGLPRSVAGALNLVASPKMCTMQMDTGFANDVPFFNAMGLGLDAEVSRRFNRLTRRGLPAYVRTAWGAWREVRMERCTIEAANQCEEMDALLVAVANSDQYGNHALIAPGARLDDGMLDLVAVRPVGLLGAAKLAARLFLGTIDRSSRVVRMRGQTFHISREKPGVVHTDGETHRMGTTIQISIAPGSLRVRVPIRGRAGTEEPLRDRVPMEIQSR